ncbi:MAG: FAD-dependent oxidoreductase, partial [Proteobacteria bacterium]|nr:FAD-dependent oxidoreductase [Pseudomonadota bacterium]
MLYRQSIGAPHLFDGQQPPNIVSVHGRSIALVLVWRDRISISISRFTIDCPQVADKIWNRWFVTGVSKVHVIVLGAGVVGVSTAYYLAKAGHKVTVVDRQPSAGLETSFANGGQISAEHVEPWADPAALKTILTSIGRADAPLAFRIRADLDQWRWGLQFFRNCTTARARRNTERNIKLALYSRRLLQELRTVIDIDYDLGTGGILEIFDDPKEFEHARR